VKYWEIIADRLKNAGWSLGYVSALDQEGRTIWIADAHRGVITLASISTDHTPWREDYF
jgi:hypothetical protein